MQRKRQGVCASYVSRAEYRQASAGAQSLCGPFRLFLSLSFTRQASLRSVQWQAIGTGVENWLGTVKSNMERGVARALLLLGVDVAIILVVNFRKQRRKEEKQRVGATRGRRREVSC